MMRKKEKFEKNSEESVVLEDLSALQLKDYTTEHFLQAVNDLSLYVDNAYFRTPYNRCPSCNHGNSAVMAYFGKGGENKIGGLRGFQATIGDIIAWKSDTYSGLSVVISKENGVFGLETSHFSVRRDEPAIVERLVVPQKYRGVLGQMAMFLANPSSYPDEDLVKIGEREYPNAIKTNIQKS